MSVLLGVACVGARFEIYLLVGFGLIAFIAVYNFSLGPLTWALMAQRTPEELQGVPIFFHWVWALVIAQGFPRFTNYFGIWVSFGGFAGITLVLTTCLNFLFRKGQKKLK